MYSKKKVAAYARVSTDNTDQIHSLSAQRAYFTEYISSNSEWELVEVYYDEGITGTSTKKRDGFNRMIADCEKGKINTILTKEVSRFARNTVDTLNYTRKLKDLNINVIFMNDGIDTNDKDGELRLTLMASIAQEESRKISERVKWTMKRNMENGMVFGCGRIYGYKVINGQLEVVPEEAEIVKEIFHSYLYDGKGSTRIAHDLSERGIPTLKNRVWSGQHILRILANEKYVGDLTQWKVYKPNVLSEKYKVNRGDNPDAPLITVRNHHEGIISRDVWNAVQAERLNRSRKTREGMRHSKVYWFSGLCVCGKCGYSFITNGSSNNPWRHVTCRNRQLHGTEKRTAMNGELIGCDNHTVDERILAKAMRSVMQSIQQLSERLKTMMMDEIRLIEMENGEVDISAKQEEVAKLKQKKLKAVDLMLEGLLDKDSLREQTEFYDREVARLSEEISNHKNAETVYNEQIEALNEAIRQVQFITDSDTDNTELYRSIVEKIVVPDYQRLDIYIKDLPIAFNVKYTTLKAPCKGIYDILIDYCQMTG